eukprot:scaffold26.g3327.t1
MALCPAIALLLLSGLSVAYAISGVATAYGEPGRKDSTGKNSCGFGNIGEWEYAYAAVGSSMSGHCGECAEVCGARGCAVVKIIDSCASCAYGHIDLSSNILQATTGYRYDRKPVTWSFVSCSGGRDSSSKSSGSGDVVPTAPSAPYVPPPCPFQDGQLVRCPSTGDIFKIESAQRRYMTTDVWTSIGSPAYGDYDCTSISYCPLGAPIDGPASAAPAVCTLTEGSWVQEDAPSDTTYFFTQGQLRPVDYAFWASVGSPPPARIGNAALAPCPKGPPLTLASPPPAPVPTASGGATPAQQPGRKLLRL